MVIRRTGYLSRKCRTNFIEGREKSKPVVSFPFHVPSPGSMGISKVIKDVVEITSKFRVPTDASNGQTLRFIVEG